MKQPFQITTFVRPICVRLPTTPISPVAIVIGWGKDRSGEHGNELKEARVEILSDESCEYTTQDLNSVGKFGQDLFCGIDHDATGSGTCYGDSGSKLI